jgi:sialate O-acetylesterase
MRTKRVLITLLIGAASVAVAEVKLPAVISEGMVLQQGQSVPIWGWSDPGEKITVDFDGQHKEVNATPDGSWQIELTPLKASAQPAEMTVKGSNTIKVRDVLVGEVWFCSGQSNMEWPMARIANAEEEIKKADNPLIRHFKAPKRYTPTPEKDIDALWTKTAPTTIAGNSAVAYMFGRRLHQALDNVPIGLINSSWGGTRIEPWTPTCGFRGIPELSDILRRVESATPESEIHRKLLNKYIADLNNWIDVSKKLTIQGKPITPAPTFPRELVFESGTKSAHQQPTVLYNGMMAGIVPYAIKGAIWYQGESNRGDGMLYLAKTKALVEGWRKKWNLPDMPYYLVQLAPYKYGGDENLLPEMWEAQAAMPKKIPHTGYTVINDIATLDNIHPPNKQDVGARLANQALNRTYGIKEIEWSGPIYRNYAIEKDRIRINFDFAKGLKTRDGKSPDWFEICGADGRFVKAHAKITGESVLISSPEIKNPIAFRFAWHQLAEPNLVNHLGLPTGAFRDGKKIKIDGAKQLKELSGFHPIYEIDLPASPKLSGGAPAYKLDKSAEVGKFTRVAYLLQLQNSTGVQYVMTAMDTFTEDVRKLTIPPLTSDL